MDFDLLLDRLLSPLELTICFTIILFCKGRAWSVPIAAIAATGSSALVPDIEATRTFWYSLLACCIQASIIYAGFVIKDKYFKK